MRNRWLVNVAIVAFLGVQLFLPMRVLLESSFYPNGRAGREFSWGMYARSFNYAANYRVVRPDGRVRVVQPLAFFAGLGLLPRVLEPGRLVAFHAYLCATLRARGELETGDMLMGRVVLRPFHGEPTHFVVPRADVCTAENHGVRRDL